MVFSALPPNVLHRIHLRCNRWWYLLSDLASRACEVEFDPALSCMKTIIQIRQLIVYVAYFSLSRESSLLPLLTVQHRIVINSAWVNQGLNSKFKKRWELKKLKVHHFLQIEVNFPTAISYSFCCRFIHLIAIWS